ncbi:Cytochrome b-c1 complex subunit 10 [Trinorchestia longiramus]|nr:Cytochrome b-c1 complex subunit 10 [Trinorchestia longiramus]
MPGLFSKISSGQLTLGSLSGWRFPSIARYGVAIAVLGVFISEWKVVTRYLPVYNLKYENNVDYDFLREQDIARAEAEAEAKAKAAEKAAAAAAAQ